MNEKKRKTKNALTYVGIILLIVGIIFTGTPIKKISFVIAAIMYLVVAIMELKNQQEWIGSLAVSILCFITAHL